MLYMLENEYQIQVIELLTQINDNILGLQEHLTHLKDLAFTTLVLGLVIVILGIIYYTVSKFIR